tara:strand:+ start:1140 stop:3401 length:2262 start_codon:yes stop_codon:yes gene_type:complete
MATPELSYGGRPLLHDHDHGAQDFFDKYHPINGMITEIEESLHRTNSRTGDRGDAYVGLPLPNYPKVPPLRINQLYWPTGAARWSRGYFLCTYSDYLSLIVEIDQPRKFKAIISDTQSIVADMYLLPPRQVSIDPLALSRGDRKRLMLLPLVDERYFWQFRNFGPASISTWNALFASLETQLGITILSTNVGWPTTRADAAYLDPDHLTLNRKYDNAAVILDATVHSLNQRICRDPSGFIYSRDWPDSILTTKLNSHETPDEENYAVAAGGPYVEDPIPETLQIIFPKATCGAPRFERTYYLASRTAEEYKPRHTSMSPLPLKSVSGSIKTIHSAQWANYNDAETTFKNQVELDALADKIATDYYLQFSFPRHDITWVGIKDWTFSGYDDHAMYSFGCEHERPEIGAIISGGEDDLNVKITESYSRRYTTRVVSPPGNFGTEQQLTNNIAAVPPQGLLPVVLTAALAANGSATANQLTWSAGWTEDTDCGVTVYEPFGVDSFNSGDKLFVRRGEDSGRWETLGYGSAGAGGSGSAIVRVKAKVFFEPNQVKTTFDKFTWAANAWSDSGLDIGVQDANDNCCLLTSEFGWAMQLDTDDWVMIGPQGLHRKVKADAHIPQNGTGTCSIWYHTGTCDGFDSDENITVCNGGSNVDHHRAILAGEVFYVSYYEGMWHADSVPRGPLLGKPQADVQDGSAQTFDIFKRVGGAWVDTTMDVTGVRNLTGITLKTDVYYEIAWHGLCDEPLAKIIQYAVC